MDNKIKAWFDKVHGEYRLYLPDGTPFPLVVEHEVRQRKGEVPTATFEAVVEVVNEKPQPYPPLKNEPTP